MVRGHGNRPPWKAAGRLASTELGLQSLSLTELLSDMRHWREAKAGCLAPCAVPPPSPPPDASGAPVAAAAGAPLAAPGLVSAAWSEVCWKHCQPSPSHSTSTLTLTFLTLTLILSLASTLTLTRSAGSTTPSRRVPPSCARAACGRG